VPDPENGNVQVVVRRRRTRRHRRNRQIRRSLALVVVAICVISFSSFALRYFSPSVFGRSQSASGTVQHSELRLDEAAKLNRILSDARPSRPVYPYSVVAGGVEDAKELKWVAEHDPIVGAHYAGFDYARARVVRLTLARTAYLSYRIGNHIYWTRRRITLHKGEKVITDGRMTARTRCANRVEGTPQQEAASPVEPPAHEFDEPIRPGEGIAMQSPGVPFESALVTRPQMPGVESVRPLSLYDPFVGGSFVPLSPPPLPRGLCAPAKAKDAAGSASGASGKKKNPFSCEVSGGGPEPVPEPGTWILFASGLVAIYWHARRKWSPA
jgi:PEP-CTERM motif